MYTRIHLHVFQNFHEALFRCIHIYTYTPTFFKNFGYYYYIYYHNILTQNFIFLFYLDVYTYTRIHPLVFQNFHEALFGCKHVYTYTPPFFKIFGYHYIIYYHNILTQNFLFLFYLDVYMYTRIHPHFSKILANTI